jgi:hypothetical protein
MRFVLETRELRAFRSFDCLEIRHATCRQLHGHGGDMFDRITGHSRGALAHLVMRSVAERVVRLASCPVLTVRHPEHEFVQPDALTVAVPT